jgi:beta-1,4-N-acetylglucosaminyltransferase
MILVTVGLHPQGFDRLVQAADAMASLVEETVIIQYGSTRYRPKRARHFDFVDEAEMRNWLGKARVVVSHGGAGSILSALQANKPLVVVPRLKRFGEVFDNHQLELTEALAQLGRSVTVTDLSSKTLSRAVEEAELLISHTPADCKLQVSLRDWLGRQTAQSMPRRWRFLKRVPCGG